MRYHRGLVRQSGHGFGGLLKVASKFAVPLIGQVVGGLLGGAPTPQQQQPQYHQPPPHYYRRRYPRYDPEDPEQEGRGLFTDLLKSAGKNILTAAANTGLDMLENKRSLKDSLKTHGLRAVKETASKAMPQLRRKLKARPGDSVLTGMVKKGARKSMKVGYRTGLDVLQNKRSLRQALQTHGRQALKKKRKQKGKGMFTDLLKAGAKQALRAAANTGLDMLENKRSLKESLKTHGLRAAKNTASMAKRRIFAKGGPNQSKRIHKRGNRPPQRVAKRAKRVPKHAKRSQDIFD